MTKYSLPMAAAAGLLALSGLANAGPLNGYTVRVAHYGPDLNTFIPAKLMITDVIFDQNYGTFAPATEASPIPFSIGFTTDSSVSVGWSSYVGQAPSGSFFGYVLDFYATHVTRARIEGVSIDASSTLIPTSVTTDGSRIFINIAGQQLSQGSFVKINIASAVPELASWAQMAMGFSALGLAMMVRSRRR